MIFLEVQLDDAISYVKSTNDYYLKKFHSKNSALADPQFAVKYIKYLISKDIDIPLEFEMALFKNRSLDYAKSYIDILVKSNKTPSKAFLDRISKTYLKSYWLEHFKKPEPDESEISSFNIILKPRIDSDLPTLISEAIAISRKLKLDLSFPFNGTEINITPTSNYDEIYKLISTKLLK